MSFRVGDPNANPFFGSKSLVRLQAAEISPRWYHELRYWQSAGYTDGFAYVIREETEGPIKIGKAHDPESRLKSLQTGNCRELNLLHVVPGYGRMETEFHRRMTEAHVRGEWFAGPAAEGFLKWIKGESARLIERHRYFGELPMTGPAPRKRSPRVSGDFMRRGLRRSWRTKPATDAPVTVKFVDPASLRKEAA